MTFSTPPPAGCEPAFPRIRRYRVFVGMGENRAREPGGIPMDLERGKRMDPTIHIPPAADPALSARSELLKNKINIDKFTGFFDKFLKITDYASDCNQKSYHMNLSVPHSDMARKKSQASAFARICDESSAVSRISPQVLHPPHPLPCPRPRPEKPGWILTPK